MTEKKQPTKRLVSINLDIEVIEEIDKLAESLGISRSALVNLIMRATCMGEAVEVANVLMAAAKNSKGEKKRAAAPILT